MADNTQVPIPRLEVHGTVRLAKERHGRYRLEGSKCEGCGELWFPRRFVCGKCHSRDLSPYQCSHRGQVVTAWVDCLGFPAIGYEEIDDRIIAMVRLDDGVHVLSEIVDADPQDATAGARVKMVVRRHKRDDTGNWVYGFKFCLADQ